MELLILGWHSVAVLRQWKPGIYMNNCADLVWLIVSHLYFCQCAVCVWEWGFLPYVHAGVLHHQPRAEQGDEIDDEAADLRGCGFGDRMATTQREVVQGSFFCCHLIWHQEIYVQLTCVVQLTCMHPVPSCRCRRMDATPRPTTRRTRTNIFSHLIR